MRLMLDKIASSTRNAGVQRRVVVGPDIPAVPGTVIAVRVLDDKATYNRVEDAHGRMVKVHRGDLLAGVLGARRALRGYSGEVPEQVRVGDILHLLNLGGVIGKCTSANPDLGPPGRVEVLGAVLSFRELGRRVGVAASIFPGPVALADTLNPLPPAVFVVGTCMHAGKTRAACELVRAATALGLRVGCAKITGVALRSDSLEMQDHGAVVAYTFADAGLPSTCTGDALSVARGCLNAVASHDVDLMVVELGDGLLGEYGVRDILAAPDLRAAATAVVLSATDPVAAWGGCLLLEELGIAPTAITGPATDNMAGVRAIHDRVGPVPAANARTEAAKLTGAVLSSLGFGGGGARTAALESA